MNASNRSGTVALCAKPLIVALAATGMLVAGGQAAAAEWSDTSISLRAGNKYHEPFNRQDIGKTIIGFTHVSGYKYGSNFVNADFLMSDGKDPSTVGGAGAQEVYLVYRHTLDMGKITGKKLDFGFVKNVGLTFGFDANAKNDFGYGSKKRMLVAGPTLMLDVPGFMNVSLLVLDESNAPVGVQSRYKYKTHPMLTAAWGIPIGSSPFSYEGFINLIANKGKNEFGGQTKAETNFDSQIMLDVGKVMGGPERTFKVGLQYQYWKNKFGNDASGAAGPGATAKTPMIRAEYHF